MSEILSMNGSGILALMGLAGNVSSLEIPEESPSKLLRGRLEIILVLLYSSMCLGGLLANTAIIIAILGEFWGFKDREEK